MKSGILAGVGLLVGGIVLAVWCHGQLGQFDGFLGEAKVHFSGDQRSKKSTYTTGRLAGILLAGAGVAVLAVSAARKGSR